MQAEQANKRRYLVPEFKIGDIIILDTRNIKTTQLNKSLDHKNLGLYKVVRVINNSIYKLKLLPALEGIFLVFYL